MTLKKGFILEKNHTHVKVGHTSEFLFGIYWWTLKNLKNQNFEKNEKDLLGDIMILHMCTKSHNHIKYSSCDTELDRIFLSFWAISQLEILSFYTVYHKWWSYDVWFLKYWAQQTELFVISSYFLPFYPLTTRKIKILKKWKKTPGSIIIFKHEYHTWKSCDIWFLRYGSRQTEFFLILNHLLPFYTPSPFPTTQRIKILKKHLEISSFYSSVP